MSPEEKSKISHFLDNSLNGCVSIGTDLNGNFICEECEGIAILDDNNDLVCKTDSKECDNTL